MLQHTFYYGICTFTVVIYFSFFCLVWATLGEVAEIKGGITKGKVRAPACIWGVTIAV